MKNKDLSKVAQGIIAVVVGILIAVLGIGAVMDTYLAIFAIVVGSILMLLAGYVAYNKKPLPLATLAMGGSLVAIGIGVFADYISFAMLINIIVVSLYGVGVALIIYGIYVAAKHNAPFGVAFIVVGGALIAMASCYIAFEDFRKVFWIVTGILIAVYGALLIVLALTDKNGKKK